MTITSDYISNEPVGNDSKIGLESCGSFRFPTDERNGGIDFGLCFIKCWQIIKDSEVDMVVYIGKFKNLT